MVATARPISFTLDELFLLQNAVETKATMHQQLAEDRDNWRADGHRELAANYTALLEKINASFEDHGFTLD